VSWRIILHPAVNDDLVEASRWYENQQTGLGREFITAVVEALKSLGHNPYLNAHRGRYRQARWRLAKPFPYRVIYEVREDEQLVKVICILHSARHDRHWRQLF
jgi:plasmid stabilization system protein ParE